jgi:hypothetical protein
MILAVAGTADSNGTSWVILIIVILACLGLFSGNDKGGKK